ncbi:oxaloacetate decarboxylase [Rhizorhabdus sp.]|jgi:2-methylisocitrate lyase-like PEP mutase family enzyme|uniref:isocitrate lyase/PEP mutase family protein n=1 Tax=Rhizorhabdus sp. TaxID=1968843 RepID=UPI001B511A4D|nr:isocitrate lyase/PEP mutase family protein [Rhizorhabdus sp.]MBP8233232.1 isocitrate lyase/PEP mutase family protein [Rhizorhabdus sp.]
MADPRLSEMLQAGRFVVAPGIQDMITATIAREIGFDAVYGSGYWLTASAYGLPDAGIASVTQMTDRMATLVASSNAPVIADADTGYGGLLNVHHTVRAYEAAGVTAIQIEDQQFPKKCGHTPYKRIVPIEDMVEKIKVAVDARGDSNFLVIARTDAIQSEGFDGLRRRMDAYAEAGADILFPEALASEEQMRIFCAGVDTPVLANMASGGVTPILPPERLEEIGFSLAIFPALASLVSAAAVEDALRALKGGDGSGGERRLFDFQRFCSLIGFEDVWAFERKWARPEA